MRARDNSREASASSEDNRNGDAVARYVVPSKMIDLLGVLGVGVAAFETGSIEDKTFTAEPSAVAIVSDLSTLGAGDRSGSPWSDPIVLSVKCKCADFVSEVAKVRSPATSAYSDLPLHTNPFVSRKYAKWTFCLPFLFTSGGELCSDATFLRNDDRNELRVIDGIGMTRIIRDSHQQSVLSCLRRKRGQVMIFKVVLMPLWRNYRDVPLAFRSALFSPMALDLTFFSM